MTDKNARLESERLFYRGISRDDAEIIVKWRSNPNNYRHFFNAKALTLEDHLAWFESYLNDASRLDFIIIDSDDCRIGTVGLSRISDSSCEISYMIGEPAARRKGYACEAVRALTRYAMDALGLRSIVARIKPGNTGSIRVVESVGYALISADQDSLAYQFEDSRGEQ